jgi:carbohydrate-binding DOMON domain-containing protein
MRPMTLRSLLSAAAVLAPLAALAAAPIVSIDDPTGDDDGPGTYTYPTDAVYKPGSFDITRFEVVPAGGEQVELRVTVRTRIEDPWDSAAWGGNGFSVQMAFIHLDTDHVKGSGVTMGLPGTNVRFAEDEAWDRVVIISPQGPTRVNSEVDQKCPQWKSRIVVPRVTRAEGKTLVALVDAKDLGGMPKASWGYQVLMQSNEGFPAKTDLLTRKVNEFEGQHRFGGGSDFDNDPQVMDLLVPPDGDAKKKQHEILGKWKRDVTDPKPEDLVVVPMVYPAGPAVVPAAAK